MYLGSNVTDWRTSIKYLGVHIVCCKSFAADIDLVKCSFFCVQLYLQ